MLNTYAYVYKILIFIDLKIKLRVLIIVIVFLQMFSCNKKQENVNDFVEKKSELSLAKEYKLGENIKPIFLKDVESWNQLNALNRFLERFKKTSPNETLSNALELKELVKNLKDSLKTTTFNTPPLQTRVHILENEVLRLADMTFIPAIKAEEVSEQTQRILNAYSAINAKINAILVKKQFEDAIDIDVDFIGLDSTKIDSVSKKTIDTKIEEKLKSKKLKTQKLKEVPIFKNRKNG